MRKMGVGNDKRSEVVFEGGRAPLEEAAPAKLAEAKRRRAERITLVR